MNPIKQISRLEKKIEKLESEITFSEQSNQDVERLKNEYAAKLKLAEQRELEYNIMLEQLKKEHEIYKKSLKKLDFIISKGLNNAELIKKASELYSIACNELYAASKLQFNLTSNLLNLLNAREFAPFKDKIELGNRINVRADEALYQLRLISLSVDYGNLKNISVTFSNAVKVDTVISDTQSILNQAKSMAVSYDYVAHQASQGNEAQKNVQTWLADGLNSSLVQIKNNDNEEITYDNHGLWARSWDDITEAYLPEQLRITSNILAFTKDNWLTCSAALGKHAYTYYDKLTNSFADAVDYGLSAQFVQAGYIYGTQIIGGDIYSDNYSPTSGTYINLRDGSFSFAGGKLKYDNNILSLKGDITANTLNATNSGKISCWNFNNNALYRGKCELGSAGSFYFGVDGISIGNQFIVDRNGNFSFAGGKLKYDGNVLNISDNFIVKSDGSVAIYGEIRAHDTIYMNFIKGGSDWSIDGNHPIILKDNIDASISFGILDEGFYITFDKHYGTFIVSNGKRIFGEEHGLGNYVFCYKDLACMRDVNVDGTLYTSSGTVSKSDKENKNSITPLSKIDSANFIYSLNPTQYKLNDGTSNRYHHGFLAQEVKEAMGTKDWGLYIDTAITNDSSEKEKNSFKALRYEELIADLVATVQSQNERISLLEQELIER